MPNPRRQPLDNGNLAFSTTNHSLVPDFSIIIVSSIQSPYPHYCTFYQLGATTLPHLTFVKSSHSFPSFDASDALSSHFQQPSRPSLILPFEQNKSSCFPMLNDDKQRAYPRPFMHLQLSESEASAARRDGSCLGSVVAEDC